MVVTEGNFRSVIATLELEKIISVDTETTGLKIYQQDRLFSIIVATALEEYYFNFNAEEDHLGNYCEHILPRSYIQDIRSTFQNKEVIFMANPKFDMGMLDKEYEMDHWPDVHCVLVMDRLIYSDQMQINLASVAKRNGFAKSDVVEDYITEHHLWAWEKLPHRKMRSKLKFFNLVPFEIIKPYACLDARITFDIGRKQRELLKVKSVKIREGEFEPYNIEIETTKVLYKMEKEGFDLDEKFIKEKGEAHALEVEKVARRFHDETKQVFIDSAKSLSPLFIGAGHTPPRTEKDNDSIPDSWLETLTSPLAKLVQDIRTNAKSAGFYKSYQWYLGSDSKLHANINQAGTRTGRFSMSNPNLQQMPDNEVRKSFIAPANFTLVSLDFDQQEYRMMLDYAGQTDLIEQVKNGLDVHSATALLMGVQRNPAKTLNFMLLYGGGVVKLAMALFKTTTTEPILWAIWKMANGWRMDKDDLKWAEHITREMREENLVELRKAQDLRELYFSKLPKVRELIEECKEAASNRGFVYTWTGRKIYFKDDFSYKSPNGLIQGGASDVCKISLCRVDKLLEGYQSKLLASIHDEIIVKVHKDEMDLIPQIRNVMETAYPHKLLPLTVGVNVGPNLFDMEKYSG